MKYLREWEEKCRAEHELKKARETGLSDGRTEKMLSLILAKVKKNKTLETTANELETEPEDIRQLYEFAWLHSDQSAEELMEIWRKQSNQ